MSIDVKIEDNSKEFLKELESRIPAALEECGLAAEGYAKGLCPVDTGLLRNSISHSTDDNTAYIGTNVEYAAYVELGTKKMKAQPYLMPAVVDHQSEYNQIIKRWLGK